MKILFVAWRELASFFATPLGWILLASFLVVTGTMWTYMVQFYVITQLDLVYNPTMAAQLNLTDHVLAPYYGNAATVLLFLVPAITMRTFAHEYSQRTYELLATSPIGLWELVFAKYAACMGFVVAMLVAWSYQPLMLAQWGNPDPGVIAGAYLGLLLMSSLLVSMGMWFSSLTSSQSVALVVTFSVAFGLFLLNWSSNYADPDGWVAKMAMASHLSPMMSGSLRLSDVMYFLGGTGVFLFATYQRLESFRWS